MRNVPSRMCLVFLLAALCASAAFPQGSDVPRVLVQSSPLFPLSGEEWTLTLLIQHPNPHEVTIIAPRFSETFFLDRVLKNFRYMQAAGAAERWTEAEYRLIPRDSGAFTIEPFTVHINSVIVRTEPITVTVRDVQPTAAVPRPRLTWENVPAQLRVGESANFGLRISGWDTGLQRGLHLPDAAVFMPPLNEAFIIEAEDAASGGSGLVMRLRVIPLVMQNFYVPGRSVTHNNIVFEIPALSIRVLPRLVPAEAADEVEVKAADTWQAGAFPAMDTPLLSGSRARLFFRVGTFRAEYEAVYRAAGELYGSGSYAEALALLRQNERDHAAFPLFASLRRHTEMNLGLPNTQDEKPIHFVLVCCAALCAAFVCLLVFFRNAAKAVKSVLCALLLICGAFALLYWLSGTFAFGSPQGSRFLPAVVRGTELRQIPDFSSEPLIHLNAGQAVRIFGVGVNRQNAEHTAQDGSPWVFVDAHDGVSGWIPADRAVYY